MQYSIIIFLALSFAHGSSPPIDSTVFFKLDSLEANEDWKAAHKTLDSLLLVSPNDSSLLLKKSFFYFQNGQYRKALQFVQHDEIVLDPFLLALVYIEIDSNHLALKLLNTQDTSALFVRLNKERIFLKAKHYRKAFQSAKKTILLYPNSLSAHANFAHILSKIKHPFSLYTTLFILANNPNNQLSKEHYRDLIVLSQRNDIDSLAFFISELIYNCPPIPKKETWQSYYLRFFHSLNQNKLTISFAYFVQQGNEDPALVEWLLQNSKSLEPLYTWLYNKLPPSEIEPEADFISPRHPQIFP